MTQAELAAVRKYFSDAFYPPKDLEWSVWAEELVKLDFQRAVAALRAVWKGQDKRRKPTWAAFAAQYGVMGVRASAPGEEPETPLERYVGWTTPSGKIVDRYGLRCKETSYPAGKNGPAVTYWYIRLWTQMSAKERDGLMHYLRTTTTRHHDTAEEITI